MEDEETLEETLVREVMEETSLAVQSFKLLGEHDGEFGGRHSFFEIVAPGEPELGGPEKEGMDENNVYILEWVDINTAKTIADFYPKEVQQYF